MGNITWNLAYSSFPYMFLSYSSFSCNSQHKEIDANKKERVSALDGLIDGYMGGCGGWGSLTGLSTAFSHRWMDSWQKEGRYVVTYLKREGPLGVHRQVIGYTNSEMVKCTCCFCRSSREKCKTYACIYYNISTHSKSASTVSTAAFEVIF